MKTEKINLSNESGGIISFNCAYQHSEHNAIPVHVIIEKHTQKATVQSRWFDMEKEEKIITLQGRDEVETPWGTYTLYDNHGTGVPVIILPNVKPVTEATIIKLN